MKERDYEKLLKIKTTGRDDSNSDLTNYPYEATSYLILKELSNSGYITKKDKLIDYGSGKGRVDFYLAYATKTKMIGIEYDERLYNKSLENHNTAISSTRVEFINCCATKYEVPDDITGAYFFNPFSIEILQQVLNNIYTSFDNDKRNITLFFYYPSDKYKNLLNNEKNLVHIEDINCESLFKSEDKREYISIYNIKNTQ